MRELCYSQANRTFEQGACPAGLDPPSRRHPCRRRGRVFAADGCGWGGDARTPQGASPRDQDLRM